MAQFGCSGYWIDYGAQHPVRPGQMVLAIECDGASYHSSATARDRDRLRQEHLERLGWIFHRIWSQDWFYHREREVQRAVDAYYAAVAEVDRRDGRGFTVTAETPTEVAALPASNPDTPDTPPPARRRVTGPVAANRPGGIDAYTRAELVATLRWIESDTLLRTEDELLDETMSVLGFSRKGSKIVTAITDAIRYSRTSG